MRWKINTKRNFAGVSTILSRRKDMIILISSLCPGRESLVKSTTMEGTCQTNIWSYNSDFYMQNWRESTGEREENYGN